MCACLKAVSDDIYQLTKIKEGEGLVGILQLLEKRARIISAHTTTAYNMLFSLSLLGIEFYHRQDNKTQYESSFLPS